MKRFSSVAPFLLTAGMLAYNISLARAADEPKPDPTTQAQESKPAAPADTGEYDRGKTITSVNKLNSDYGLSDLKADPEFMYKPGSSDFPATLNGQPVKDYIAITDSKGKLVTFQPVAQDGSLIPMSMLVKPGMQAAYDADKSQGTNATNTIDPNSASAAGTRSPGGGSSVADSGSKDLNNGAGNKSKGDRAAPTETKTPSEMTEQERQNWVKENNAPTPDWGPQVASRNPGPSDQPPGMNPATVTGKSYADPTSGGSPGNGGSDGQGIVARALNSEDVDRDGSRYTDKMAGSLNDFDKAMKEAGKSENAWRRGSSYGAQENNERVVDSQRSFSQRLSDVKSAIGSLAQWAGLAPVGPHDGLKRAPTDGDPEAPMAALEVDTGRVWTDSDGSVHTQHGQVVVTGTKDPNVRRH